jgi:hypothetical protein
MRRKPEDSDSRLLSTAAAAAYIGVSKNTMFDYVKMGVVPTITLPARIDDGGLNGKQRRRYLIDRQDLDALIERRKTTAAERTICEPTPGPLHGPNEEGRPGFKRVRYPKGWHVKYTAGKGLGEP